MDEYDAQALRLTLPITQSRLGIILDRIILLSKPNADEEDVGLSKRDALLLGTRFELSNADRVGRPGVVRQRVSIGGVVVNEVKEDATSADTVFRPV